MVSRDLTRVETAEARTLAGPQVDWNEAKRTYRKELSREAQMGLVEEIVVTRGAELCLAYDNVVSVSFGYKRRKDAKTGRQRIVRTPCVTFVVKRKWRKKFPNAPQSLPEFLLAYVTVDGARKLCAVPTDVEPASTYTKIRPQAARRQIATIDSNSQFGAWGAIAGTVQRHGISGRFALCCRHVFSMTEHFHDRPMTGTRVHFGTKNGPIIAKTTSVRGRLRTDFKKNMDAQLAVINPQNAAAYRAAMHGLNYARIARGLSDIPDRFWIVTGRRVQTGNGTRVIKVRAEKLRFTFDEVIDYPGVGPISHPLLIEAQVNPRTIGGDSGSPAVSNASGGTLLGMHIAGGNNLSYIIPAWQLLHPANYGRPNENWQLVNL